MNFNDLDPNFHAEQKIAKIKKGDFIARGEYERKRIDKSAQHSNLIRRIHQDRKDNGFIEEHAHVISENFPYMERVEKDLEKAYDIDREREAEFKNVKMRQMMRENCPELRDLETQLRTAYVTKELVAQMAEKEYYKLKEKEDKKKFEMMVNDCLMTTKEAEKKAKEENMRRRYQYRKELQDQMIMKDQVKQNQYEEFLREKKFVDSIILRIYDEDQREKILKLNKMKKTQNEILAFKKSQEIWKERRKKELIEENDRLEAYMRQKEIEEKASLQIKQEKEERRDRLVESLGRKMFEELKQREERQAIVMELQEEEVKEEERRKQEEKIRKQIESNLQTKLMLEEQLEDIEKRKEREKIIEIQWAEQIWAKMAADNKLEQLSDEKRRRKMIELRHQAQDEMRERRIRRAEELKQRLYLLEQEKASEELRRKVIEEERMRILKEHAAHLIGYMPPGVLREDDIIHLGCDVVKPKSVPCLL